MEIYKHESDLVLLDEHGRLVTPTLMLKIDEFSLIGLVLRSHLQSHLQARCDKEVTSKSIVVRRPAQLCATARR